jgi:hypothetical protein
MVFLLLLALACLDTQKWNWSTLPLLMLSVLTKYASVLAVPFVLVYMFQQRKWNALVWGGLLAVLLAVLLAIPYVELGHHWPWAALLDNAGKSQHSIADMLARMVYYPAKWLKLGDAKMVMEAFLKEIKPLLWAVFVLFYAWQGIRFLKRQQSFTSLVAGIALVMTVMAAFVSAKFHPWYVVMFLPLALLLPEKLWLRRFAVWFSVFQIAGFTLLQNVHVINVLLLTVLPLMLSLKANALPCAASEKL